MQPILDPLPLKETLYRIAQEALHNAVKHAHASHVEVRLSVLDDWLELEIGDNGTLCLPTTPGLGFGFAEDAVGRHALDGWS